VAPGGGPEAPPPLPPPPEILAFKKLIGDNIKRPARETQRKFVKKLDSIPTVALPIKDSCRSDLNLAKRGLTGQFTGLWPSPKAVEAWVQRH